MTDVTQSSSAPARVQMVKHLLPLGVAAVSVWLLTVRLGSLDAGALGAAFGQIAPVQWALAVLATVASFWAVGRYDVVLHRHFSTGVPVARVMRSGAAAIAFSQTAGFGLVTGSFARWRSLPELSLSTASAITALCALSFLAALGFVTATVCLFLKSGAALWAIPFILALLALPVLAMQQPILVLPFGIRLRLPTLSSMGTITALTFLDTLFAALALYLLLPEPSSLGFTTLLPAFLIALGAGIASGSPAGIGPFELTLFALLHEVPQPELAAGLLGFRLVYYALPAALSGLALLKPAGATPRETPQPQTRSRERLLAHARRSELGVARQNGAKLLSVATSHGFTVETPQTLTALFDPADGPEAPFISALKHTARARGRIPALYKCNKRTASAARRHGFKLAHIADEALIDPQSFCLDGSAFRQLRRKLRQAAKAGIAIRAPGKLPLAEMATLDAEWQARNAGARGLSMGQFCSDYLSHQRLYLAYCGSKLVGFVSFHISCHELCLDLMRLDPKAPQGTMHALVMQAIEDAARAGRTRLSLAALPARKSRTWAGARLGSLIAKLSGSAGLAQFKNSFAPRYVPLYMAAPSHLGLAIAMLDLARAITRATPRSAAKSNMCDLHNCHDSYEFA